MLYKAKTKILFSDYWIDHLVYKPHSDYDLAGHVDAIAIKSESGSVYDFYRSGQIEEPEDFKHTKLYDYYDEVQNSTYLETDKTVQFLRLPLLRWSCRCTLLESHTAFLKTCAACCSQDTVTPTP